MIHPHLMLRKLFLCLLLFCAATGVEAQTGLNERYIARYSGMAVDQMNRYGIPASITLAQGLLESAAGTSRLAKEANNHFGIKVGLNWTGKYIVMADDRPDDRFRVYRSVEDSYEDHSKFLRGGRRYAFLFDLEPTDYKGWARGLKKAGYATNPAYATALINLIERYGLQQYDSPQAASLARRSPDKAQSRMQEKITDHVVRRCNGQYYVIAQAGDTYASLARKLRTKEKKLREYNDVPSGYRLRPGDIVYLGKKRKKADKTMKRRYHVMQQGESLYSISQTFGIRLSSLCKMNPVSGDYRFKVGDEIKIK